MVDLMHLVKSQSLNLAPFFNTVVIYFVFVPNNPVGQIWTTVLKCLPIVSLMLYILLKGFALTKEYRRSQLVFFGLLFSCGGDALLNLDLFELGMVSFAVAHVFYIIAFGWRPLKWPIALVLYVPLGIFVYFMIDKLDGVLVAAVPIYSAVIATMIWRAVARAIDQKSFLAILCAVGAVVFAISDSMIALTMFLEVDLPYARLQIMITYYAAQFAIALSTSDDGPAKRQKVKSKGK